MKRSSVAVLLAAALSIAGLCYIGSPAEASPCGPTGQARPGRTDFAEGTLFYGDHGASIPFGCEGSTEPGIPAQQPPVAQEQRPTSVSPTDEPAMAPRPLTKNEMSQKQKQRQKQKQTQVQQLTGTNAVTTTGSNVLNFNAPRPFRNPVNFVGVPLYGGVVNLGLTLGADNEGVQAGIGAAVALGAPTFEESTKAQIAIAEASRPQVIVNNTMPAGGTATSTPMSFTEPLPVDKCTDEKAWSSHKDYVRVCDGQG
jgi:hypothetical protein